MARTLLTGAFGLVAACGDNAIDCNLRPVVARFVDDSMRDCGDLPIWTTPNVEPVYRAAHDCVTASLAAEAPFVVQWDPPTIDSNASAAYVGVRRDGRWTILHFEAYGYTGNLSRQHTQWSQCMRVEPIVCDARSQLLYSLCFTCVAPARIDECRDAS